MPVDHVILATFPWRFDDLPGKTYCGRDVSDVPGGLITYAEWHTAAAEWDELCGSFSRAKMAIPALLPRPNICLICWERCSYFHSWERLPIRFLWRHLDRFGFYPVGADAEQMCRELWALGQLAQRHRAEFDALVAGMRDGYRRDTTEV